MVPRWSKTSLTDYGFTGGTNKEPVDGGKRGRKRRSRKLDSTSKLESFGFTRSKAGTTSPAEEMDARGKVQGGGGGKETEAQSKGLEKEWIKARKPTNPSRKRKSRD